MAFKSEFIHSGLVNETWDSTPADKLIYSQRPPLGHKFNETISSISRFISTNLHLIHRNGRRINVNPDGGYWRAGAGHCFDPGKKRNVDDWWWLCPRPIWVKWVEDGSSGHRSLYCEWPGIFWIFNRGITLTGRYLILLKVPSIRNKRKNIMMSGQSLVSIAMKIFRSLWR